MEQLIQIVIAGINKIIAALRGQMLGDERQRRFFVINITVPNGSAADIPVEASQQLDRAFNKIVGIGFFPVNDGGIPGNYNVGVRSQIKQWIDPINVNAWIANEGVGPMEKYYKSDIPYGSGDTFYVAVTPGDVTTEELNAQLVLILEKSLTEVSR